MKSSGPRFLKCPLHSEEIPLKKKYFVSITSYAVLGLRSDLNKGRALKCVCLSAGLISNLKGPHLLQSMQSNYLQEQMVYYHKYWFTPQVFGKMPL